MLDNMDGKQARKTGSSSPLGLLFDHGADGINSVLVGLSVPSLVQTGSTWSFMMFALSITTGFYFATLEQYYSGSLALPVINGVSDGCVILILVELLSAYTGIALSLTHY